MSGGGGQQQTAVRVTRLPGQTDPAVRQAQMRAEQEKKRTSGRTSTILTDALRSIVGSGGKLGA
jgi:hypothetical protein